MSSITKSHKKVINKDVKRMKPSNSRVKPGCPINGQCNVIDIIHKCNVLSPDKLSKMYLRTAKDDFQRQFYSHRKPISIKTSIKDTILSKNV